MAAIDAAATEPVEVLIERAGAAVARHARAMMGGTYGRRVAVVCGPGNNGNDGRVAACRLRELGVRVAEFDAAQSIAQLPEVDLVIDAAYGTGLRRPYVAPELTGDPLVLAVDIPSGIDGLTGAVLGQPLKADATVTFAALKPGLVLQPGRSYCGEIIVTDIGLDTASARAWVIEASDIAAMVPRRRVDVHKWQRATWVVAGSPGMTGAAQLAASAAARAGAGYVRLSVPGGEVVTMRPVEAVQLPLGRDLRIEPAELARVQSMVIGPGLGRGTFLGEAVRRLVATADVPIVVDGDALVALGSGAGEVLRGRTAGAVLTPHDGEFRALTGRAAAADRTEAARGLAAETGAVVLLKGATTVVASPEGEVCYAIAGDARLATAGTGDVLSGIIGAFLAQGATPFHAAAAGAFVHGRAARMGSAYGLVAGDLVSALPRVLSSLFDEAGLVAGDVSAGGGQ